MLRWHHRIDAVHDRSLVCAKHGGRENMDSKNRSAPSLNLHPTSIRAAFPRCPSPPPSITDQDTLPFRTRVALLLKVGNVPEKALCLRQSRSLHTPVPLHDKCRCICCQQSLCHERLSALHDHTTTLTGLLLENSLRIVPTPLIAYKPSSSGKQNNPTGPLQVSRQHAAQILCSPCLRPRVLCLCRDR